MADISFFRDSRRDNRPSESDINLRRKMAEMLFKNGQQDGSTQVISGYAVPKSPLEGLSNAVSTSIGGYMEGQAAKEEQLKADNARKTMADAMGAYSKSQSGDTTQLGGGESVTWNKMPTDRAGQMYANMLMQNEDTAPLGMQALQQNIANQQQMELLKQKQIADDANWYREAELKRELARMRGGAGGYSVDPDTGEIVRGYSDKPLPVGALKMQQEAVDALAAAKNTAALSEKLQGQVQSGALDLGPMSNLVNKGRNFIGSSTPESVNFGLMETDLEKLRNDTLRLNKGVQTEGDAIRAMNEVIQSKNDPKLFAAAMTRLYDINNRATQLQQMQIDQIRQNYNAAPMNLGNGNPAATQDYSQIQPLLETDLAAPIPQGGAVKPPAAPMQGGMGGPMSFNTPQEAEAANLPVGTVIMVGGRKAVIE